MPFLLLGLACFWAAETAHAVGNDNFGDAWLITNLPYTTNCTNLDATCESGEPYHHASTVGHSLWWRWTAPAAGPVQLNTTNTAALRSVLGVYTGSTVGSLTEVASGRGKHLLNFIAVAGTTYQIALDSLTAGETGAFVFQMTPGLAPPANDNFTNAAVLTGTSVSLTTTNLGATREAGEPAHAGNTGGKSVWWKWTAPMSALFQLDTTGSTYDTLLAVYTGTAVSSLALVASNDNASGSTSLLTFPAAAGSTYYFAVDGWEAKEGQINLHLLKPGPANDDFANAIAFTGGFFSANGVYNTNCTKETGEPNHAGNSGGASLWWSWTAASNGLCHADTIGSGFNTLLAVYTGTSVSNLTLVASNDDSPSMPPASEMNFNAVAGTTYFIAVDGYNGASGWITFNFSHTPATGPLNDNFANATDLTGSVVSTNGPNTSATKETGEPDHAGSPGGKSVWWRWTASTNQAIQVDTTGSDFDTLLAVYVGTAVDSLTTVAYNDQAWGTNNTSRVVFAAKAGTTYQIAVDGWNGNSGQVVIHLGPAPTPPPNDDIANAWIVSTSSYSVTTSNINATGELGEPQYSAAGATHSLWWSWTAPGYGWVEVDTAGSSFDTWLAMFSGAVTNEAGVWDDDGGPGLTSRLGFRVEAGTNYHFKVDGYDGATGIVGFHLAFTQEPSIPVNDSFNSPTSISGHAYTNYTSNRGATKQADEPNHHANPGGHSIWWAWAAPADSTVWISTEPWFALAVYTGSSLATLVKVASDHGSDNGSGSASDVSFAAQAGVTYRIAVDGWDGTADYVTLYFQTSLASLAPPNDIFTNAFSLTGAIVTGTGSDANATRESGEPNHGGVSTGGSVWWRWTAPSNGVFLVNTVGSEFDTTLGVYTGTAVNALTEVASDNDHGGKFRSRVAFHATAGTSYHIAVGSGYTLNSTTFGIELNVLPSPTQPPANDLFANASVISGATFTAMTSNAGATKEPGEPDHVGNAGGSSLWWRWTAPASGVVQVDTDGSGFDTLLAVYTGSAINALTVVTNDDNSGAGNASLLTFSAVAGTNYYIAADGVWAFNESNNGVLANWGNLNLHLQLTIPGSGPPNDHFTNATVLAGTTVSTNGSNAGATKETGEPLHVGYTGGKSVWWRWTASASGMVQVDTIGSDFDTLLAVYTGSAVNALTWVASDDQSGGNNTSLLIFNASAGMTYQIAVDGWNGATGSVALHISPSVAVPPSNDYFTNAIVISGTNYASTNISTLAASKEPGEPNHNGDPGGKSIWWRWTAPASARMEVDTVGSAYTTDVGIYTGSAVGTLTPVASGRGNQTVAFNAVADTTYQIAVDLHSGIGGDTILRLHLAPPPPGNDMFTNAWLISGSSYSISNASNVGATKETSEPNHAGFPGGKSVWWRWTAPASGNVEVDTIGSTFDTLLAIYTGSAVNALSEIVSADEGGGANTSKTNFTASVGTTYYIAVDGWNALSGTIVLHLVGPAGQAALLQNPSRVFSNSQPHLRFQITGPQDHTVVVQANTDLNQTNWTSLQTNVLTGGSLLFTDPTPATAAQKFYRARLP